MTSLAALRALEQAATFQHRPIRWWARRAVENRRVRNRQHRELGRLRRTQARTWSGTVDYALRLTSVVYSIPYSKLRAVAWCESRLDPFAVNGQYRNLFQEGPMFERGPFGRAGFSVWDPVAASLTAGYTVIHDGSWRQWSCG